MENVYSVAQVNTYVKNLFSQDGLLSRISVKGEISNCTYHRSGHIYFTLKDESSALSCVMFAGDRRGLSFTMKNGDKVVVTGSLDVYVRDGRYQLYARRIVLEGAGLLYERFLALKAELEEMGMFAPEYKQPIPKYVKRLGIVTAPTGAAVQDIKNISLRRNPYIQLILYPALVQGEGAAESIVKGIETLDAMDVDVIIVGRGGGSIEDLWAFNEEAVARAIFECATPVISAVGHETDTTIADFVADLRAPTPSAAAELAVADIRSVLERMDLYKRRFRSDMQKKIAYCSSLLAEQRKNWKHLSPQSRIREKRQRLIDLEDRLRELTGRILADNRSRRELLLKELVRRQEQILREKRHGLQLRISRLDGLSPIRKLNQGYSYAEKTDGSNIRSISQVKAGDEYILQVEDGSIRSVVREVSKRG